MKCESDGCRERVSAYISPRKAMSCEHCRDVTAVFQYLSISVQGLLRCNHAGSAPAAPLHRLWVKRAETTEIFQVEVWSRVGFCPLAGSLGRSLVAVVTKIDPLASTSESRFHQFTQLEDGLQPQKHPPFYQNNNINFYNENNLTSRALAAFT